ncbi:MAG: RecX family transcriptional regulator [Pyrinomonadaceae bacterium]|nr:RecX family transcriptional regulator [Pyrinomonadaceae bacterium]
MQKRRWKANRGRSTEEETTERESRPLNPERARERTMQRAVKLLAAKPRSVGELRERLLEKQWTNEEIVDGVLNKLSEYGYLNDERYAFGYASFKVRQKPVGRQRLQRALALKKVDKETAEEALKLVFEETPEELLIERAIEKRVRLRGRPATRAETKSLFDHLLRQGFSYELVIRKVRAVSEADVDEEETLAGE